ncbi:MAG: TolA-binding protein [Kiritimatiellia bacterium]|jgi:TolA-binding protein
MWLELKRGLSIAAVLSLSVVYAQGPMRGSIVEDRAAAKLLEAGDARFDADETEKAVEVWQSVIERYPRSKMRFQAHLKLGEYYLTNKSEYDRARGHFEAVAVEGNPDDDQRALATLKTGICSYEARNYARCFKVMRQVIEEYPVSEQVNEAYYYIGMGHFKLGHYSRAIDALEKVGTALSAKDKGMEKVEAGKRLFVKIEDMDLAVLEADEKVKALCKTKFGDEEMVECIPVGRNVRLVLGSVATRLGRPVKNNGVLDVQGGDVIDVFYVDNHTAAQKFDVQRIQKVLVVGVAAVEIMDGAYQDDLTGVVLGKTINMQIRDADFDTTAGADSLQALVEVYREKSSEELDAEMASLAAKGEVVTEDGEEGEQVKIDRYKSIDRVTITLKEADLRESVNTTASSSDPAAGVDIDASLTPDSSPDAASDLVADLAAESVDNTIHSGAFRGTVFLDQIEKPNTGDDRLQAMASDLVRVTFEDKVNLGLDPIIVKKQAKCIEGNLGGVRVTRSDISNEELRLKTNLKTAGALTHIGNHYKEFGLDQKARIKYDEALAVCEKIVKQAQQLGGSVLEETYVQLWRVYFASNQLGLAMATSQRLQREFPNSEFVDEAILQQAQVERAQGNLGNAITFFGNLVKMQQSDLRGEGQFGVAECYEDLAKKAPGEKGEALFERAFQEYKKVYEEFPESGRVGDAVAKMANFYYQKQDYARAIDVFENVLSEYPDANFLDVILFNYGRCLYRLDRKPLARHQFDQLLNDFPDSRLAEEAKKISTALATSGF